MDKLLSRSIVGIIYVFVIIFATTISSYGFVAIFTLFFLFCFWELVKLLQFEEKYMVILTGALCAYLLYHFSSKFFSGIYPSAYTITSYLPFILCVAAYVIIFRRPMELAFDSSKLIFTVVYLCLPFALFIQTGRESEFVGNFSLTPLLAFFILLWLSDTMAYVFGNLWGKTKLSKISQNKTWEGLAGGVFSVILAGVAFEYFFSAMRGNWIVMSTIVAILAPVGDLAESKLKRVFGVKDSGTLLAGHGGFLDRLDSFFLSAIGFYFYFLIENL